MPEAYECDIDRLGVYKDLCEVIQRDDLILFAGSGLSAQAQTGDGKHPPDWSRLIKEMATWGDSHGLIESSAAAELQAFVDGGYLLDAAQELQDIFTRPVLQQCLRETLLCSTARIGEAHELVAEIPFRAIITTNYDELIEGAWFKKHGFMLPRYYERTYEGILEEWRSKHPFILKLHGDILDPDSIVMGRHSYDRLLYQDTSYVRSIETIIGASSLLFVGFGGTDPNLEAILSRVSLFDGRSKRHWMLAQEDGVPRLRAKRLWLDKGITVIKYRGSHAEVVRFLQNLTNYCSHGTLEVEATPMQVTTK